MADELPHEHLHVLGHVGREGALVDERLDLHGALVLALGLLQTRLADAGGDVLEEWCRTRLRLRGGDREAERAGTCHDLGRERYAEVHGARVHRCCSRGRGLGCGGRRPRGLRRLLREDLLGETFQLRHVAALRGLVGEALEVGDGARRIRLLARRLGAARGYDERRRESVRRAS